MESLWNDAEAAGYEGELGLRVYSSRLLGRDPALVLHGGGNTSVKLTERNLLGEDEERLYVKGSGWDLATIEQAGFAPLRLAPLRRLARLPQLSDPEMVNALRTSLVRATAPGPSVETLLHAVLPYRYVDHTHADSVVALTNTPDGEQRIRETYGERVLVIPYTMPGFDLARECAQRYAREARAETVGMILMNHGVFSFGASAREAYERMIELVSLAEDHLRAHGAWELRSAGSRPPQVARRAEIAALRADLCAAAGQTMLLTVHDDERSRAFLERDDLAEISQRGPITPDHVIRTKRLPLLGRDVQGYAAAYREYFERHQRRSGRELTMLDPAPRVILEPGLGVCTAGRSAQEAGIVRDIYAHTMDVIERCSALAGYRALPEERLFEVEYWDLEQAKLRRGGGPPPFAGEAALVTGTSSGIGRACARALLERGAAVVGLDLRPADAELAGRGAFHGLRCDLTSPAAVEEALEAGVRAFGGLDMLVLNAGLFPATGRLAELEEAQWQRALSVNLDANRRLLQQCHPLLRLAPKGGRVVVIGSKNVPAPGPGAAAYSSSKAALVQLARVAALEWGGDGIRVNVLHPDAVFDTDLWTEEVLRSRARQYGLSVEEYRRRNVLGVEVRSRDVAELAAELCGALFSRTTGAQIPVDGGNERVI